MKNKLTRTPIIITVALLCCILWGSAFPFIKIGYRLFDIGQNETNVQILFAGIRFFLAGVMVIIISSILSGKPLIPKNLTTIKRIVILSMFQTILQYFFFYIGLANTSGSKAAIVEALNVFFAVLVSGLLFKMETVTSRKLFGCIIGFIGVVIINIGSSGIGGGFTLSGEGAILLSTLSYSFSAVIIKRFSTDEDTVLLSGWQFTFGGLVLMVIGFITGGRLFGSTVTTSGYILLVYLAFVSAAAYTLWSLLLKFNPVSKISVYGFLNPIFGVLLSSILLHETSALNIRSIVALILVSIGILVVNTTTSIQKKTK